MIKEQEELTDEIQSLIEASLGAGVAVQAGWIASEIVRKHPDIRGADKDFYLNCARNHVRDTVRDVTRRYKDDPRTKPPGQLVLAGFEYVQKAYLVKREDEEFIVPVDQCTDKELDQKIAEYRSMAEGCSKHADELVRYKQKRGR